MQGLPSSQAPPVGAWTQPTSLAHTSVVQALPSAQSVLPDPTQLPALQLDVAVHASPSSQVGVPATGKVAQLPVAGSQADLRQAPSLEVSQRTVESSLGAHTPLLASHLYLTEHRSLVLPAHSLSELQTQVGSPVAGLPLQTPLSQKSDSEQALPSSHAPNSEPTTVQPTARSQASLVHGLPSLQTLSLGVCWQPPSSVHVSRVQSMLSEHENGVPWQMPAMQTSPTVQTDLSSHASAGLVIASWAMTLPWSQ